MDNVSAIRFGVFAELVTYEYYCHRCETAEEHRHSIKEAPELRCKRCGERLNRQPGTGWTGQSKEGADLGPGGVRLDEMAKARGTFFKDFGKK